MNQPGKSDRMDFPRDADIIGRRELTYVADDGSTSAVSVTIRKPVQGDRACRCRVEIDGLGSKVDLADDKPCVMDVMGIDSLQALTIALSAIWMGLRPHERHLSQLGAQGDHGFPHVLPIASIVPDMDARERILASIDAQVLAALDLPD